MATNNKIIFKRVKDGSKWRKVLEDIYSKTEIKRLLKTGSIRFARNPYIPGELWLMAGKQLYVLHGDNRKWQDPGYQASILFVYFYQIMPKIMEWKTLKDEEN